MEYITNWIILEKKLHKILYESNWSSLCKLMQSCSEEAFNGVITYIKSLQDEYELNTNPEKELISFNSILGKIAAAFYLGDSIVEYTINKDLYQEFLRAKPLDRSLKILDLLKLPYHCFALGIEGDMGGRYNLVVEENDEIYVYNAKGFGVITKDHSIADLYDRCDNEDQMPWQTAFILMIAYITNNKDVINYSKIIELPNGAPSKKRKKKPKKIKQITGIVGGIFHRSMCRWKEAQETEYQNDPELRGKQRPHCRPGHWQIYWVGKGRTEARPTFVHPYLVNATDIGDVEIHYKVK